MKGTPYVKHNEEHIRIQLAKLKTCVTKLDTAIKESNDDAFFDALDEAKLLIAHM